MTTRKLCGYRDCETIVIGRSHHCPECTLIKAKEYRKAWWRSERGRELDREANRKWKAKNADSERKKARDHYYKNRDRLNDLDKRTHEAHGEIHPQRIPSRTFSRFGSIYFTSVNVAIPTYLQIEFTYRADQENSELQVS